MDTNNFQDDLDMHAFTARQFEGKVASIANDLREMADRLDHVKAPESGREDPGFGAVAASVTRDLMNLLPNLGISMLVNVAAQADTAILRSRRYDVDPNLIPVGSTVRDLVGSDDEDEAGLGTVTAHQEGGYSVVWDLGPGAGRGIGVFAAHDEVELVVAPEKKD